MLTMMKLQKFRWSKVYESQEEELVQLLASRGIEAEFRELEEFSELEMTPVKDTTLWCAEGSFKLAINSQSISMQPGDAIPVLAGTKLDITAGMSGCIIYESSARSI